jgi:hypothetical protein
MTDIIEKPEDPKWELLMKAADIAISAAGSGSNVFNEESVVLLLEKAYNKMAELAKK